MAESKAIVWAKKVGVNWLPIVAGMSGITTLGLAIADRTSSSAITAGFTIALVLAHNLPALETFKGWGVEAKLREVKSDLGKAKMILDRIDGVSNSLSVSLLNWVLYVGTIGSPSWKTKSSLMSQVRGLFDGRDMPEEAVHLELKILGAAGFWHAKALRAVILQRARETDVSTEPLQEEYRTIRPTTLDALRDEHDRLLRALQLQPDDLDKARSLSRSLLDSFRKYLRLEEAPYDTGWTSLSALYTETYGTPPRNEIYG